MDPSNVPFELISYRGLLKSLDHIKHGKIFSNNSRVKSSPEFDTSEKLMTGHESISNYGPFDIRRYEMVQKLKNVIKSCVFFVIEIIETFLFFLMSSYDDHVYSPLQKTLSPIVKQIPRYIHLSSNKQDKKRRIPIFTANLVTLSRTFLVVPICWLLKYDYNFLACMCVVYHDFLDHLDGIVAKVQKVTYPNHDDPILGGFLDAFCDKIVNVLSIWSILIFVQFDRLSSYEAFYLLAICYGVMAYETVIGIVRVQDFFLAKFKRDFKIQEKEQQESQDAKAVTAASMEGKLKEKLESTGIAFLCLSVSKSQTNQVNNLYGIIGLVCLLLTLRMAHKSLMLKLKARANARKSSSKTLTDSNNKLTKNSESADNLLHVMQQMETECKNETHHPNFENAEMKMVDFQNDQIKEQDINYKYKKRRVFYLEDQHDSPIDELEKVDMEESQEQILPQSTTSSASVTGKSSRSSSFRTNNEMDNRVDKVYTVGCFDLFHHGHVQLIKRMRELGKKVIVGVHDSRSIYKLKNRVPVDSTEKRMLNVKTLADEVFCIAGCDPSSFMTCIVNLGKHETALYVRGDDMPNFPCREVVENLMPIRFLPYTQGVSSTQIRKEMFSHIAPDDENYLNRND